jgi:hypothetical protein
LIEKIARLRLLNQRLVGARMHSAAAVVRWFGAVQAQDYPAAQWGLALRMTGVGNETIQAAFNAGEFVRTHAMRPTWHFVAAEDLRWLLELTSPRVHTVNGHMYRKLELDDVVFRRAHAIFTKTLAGGKHATRAELAHALEAKRIPASGQRLAYLVMHAELAGLICSGPVRGKHHTYMLVDERIAPTRTYAREEALSMLATRYFASHGPATAHDFSWWSGLTVAEARRATQLLSADFTSIDMAGKTYWLPTTARSAVSKQTTVHLLPNYDEHVVAYRDHGPSIDPRAPRVLDGWGNALTAHLVVVNGLVVGGWRRTIDPKQVIVRLTLPIPLRKSELAALERAALVYGEFLGLPVVISWPALAK